MGTTTIRHPAFGAKVKSLLDDRSMSIRKLAGACGFNYPAAYQYARGGSKPKGKDRTILCAAFGVSYDYLFEGDAPVTATIKAVKDTEMDTLTPIQKACLETFTKYLKTGKLSDRECLALMSKCLDADEISNNV